MRKSDSFRDFQSISECFRDFQRFSEQKGGKMNKLAYLILNVLKGENATDKMSSMSVTDIHYEIRDSHYSYSAVYKK